MHNHAKLTSVLTLSLPVIFQGHACKQQQTPTALNNETQVNQTP